MATLDNICFMDFQKSMKQIRIPGIQRDYAEGRCTKKVEDIRRTFLNELLKPVFDNTTALQLDFIYGYDRDGVFEPLDGQQRLTTLFLLQWFFRPENNNELLLKDQKESLLSYATRTSTIDFCNILVHQNASCLYKDWYDFNLCQNDENKKIAFSLYIKKRGWFEWQWQYDPSIMSMLIVLDEVCTLINNNQYDYSQANYSALQHITFHLLNLEEFDLGDELYVKMNARGKLLSSFDILKSTLEEEIQLQKLCGTKVESDWRSNIDGDWINYFWQRYYQLHLYDFNDLTYSDIENCVEMQLKALLQRFITIQYYTIPESEFAQIYADDKFEEILPSYCSLAWKNRTAHNENFPEKINFELLIDDLNNLFYKDSDNYIHIATELIDETVLWQPDVKIFDAYMYPSVNRDLLVAIYAMIIFLRRQPASQLINDEKMQKNFQIWMRFVRNITLLDNTQQRIDKPERQFAAIHAISAILDGFFNQNDDMIHYISKLSPVVGIENAVMEEEIMKAQCIISNEAWQDLILSLENNQYFWGQIIAPLKWSMQNGKPNERLFKNYADKLNLIFPLSNPNQFRAALLAIENYGLWRNCETLYLCENTMQRDRSFKSYLRNFNAGYGDAIRILIDIWNHHYSELLDVNDFMGRLRTDLKQTVLQDWRRLIVSNPELLDYSHNLILWLDNNSGHVYLRQKLRSDTQHREILMNYVWQHRLDTSYESGILINDWYPETQQSNSIFFSKQNITIKLGEHGTYLFHKQGIPSMICTIDDILNILRSESLINA